MSTITTTLAACLLLGGCEPSKRPFRLIQVCLNSVEDIPTFKAKMQAVAQAEGMVFGDRSAEAQAEAERIREVRPSALVTRPMVVISGRRNDGVSFGGGNFSEAPAQIVIGFQLGKNEAGREFSNT
ncbi:MAG TPA: hypothetical protein VLZ73_00295, partial [Brevundimonas sp.]|nr:hypothetical protein [Brevundimonas sp.]